MLKGKLRNVAISFFKRCCFVALLAMIIKIS